MFFQRKGLLIFYYPLNPFFVDSFFNKSTSMLHRREREKVSHEKSPHNGMCLVDYDFINRDRNTGEQWRGTATPDMDRVEKESEK